MKHITLGSLLTPMMIQSRNTPITFPMCLDIPCLQGKHPSSTALILIKTELQMERECNGNQDELLLLQEQLKRNRENVGPPLNFVSVGVDTSETVCDFFASVTTGKVCQAFVL